MLLEELARASQHSLDQPRWPRGSWSDHRPARIRERSIRLPITRSSRPVSPIDRLQEFSPLVIAERRPVLEEGGDGCRDRCERGPEVCVTEEKRAARSRFVSASIRASSASDAVARRRSRERHLGCRRLEDGPLARRPSSPDVHPPGGRGCAPSSRSRTVMGITSSRRHVAVGRGSRPRPGIRESLPVISHRARSKSSRTDRARLRSTSSVRRRKRGVFPDG